MSPMRNSASGIGGIGFENSRYGTIFIEKARESVGRGEYMNNLDVGKPEMNRCHAVTKSHEVRNVSKNSGLAKRPP
jgi:hypothetical protein